MFSRTFLVNVLFQGWKATFKEFQVFQDAWELWIYLSQAVYVHVFSCFLVGCACMQVILCV